MSAQHDLSAPTAPSCGLTDSQRRTFLQHLQNGKSIRTSCRAAGVSLQDVYRERIANEQFDRDCIDALSNLTLAVEQALARKALAGHHTAQVFWLTNRAPERWKNRHTVEQRSQVQLTLKDIVEQCTAEDSQGQDST